MVDGLMKLIVRISRFNEEKTLPATVADLVVLVTFSRRLRRHQTPEQQLHAAATNLCCMPYMSIDAQLNGFEAYNGEIRGGSEANWVLVDWRRIRRTGSFRALGRFGAFHRHRKQAYGPAGLSGAYKSVRVGTVRQRKKQ